MYKIDKSKASIWRYSSLLPQFKEIISYGEGLTPISKIEGVLVKNEKRNPTGSYSDRASSVLASYIKSYGIDSLTSPYVEDFTNSLTYYLRNIAKIKVLLDDLHRLSLEDFMKLVSNSSVEISLAKTTYSHNNLIEYINPYTIEGLKTIIFEIHERRLSVEYIVVPVETGILAYSLYKGIEDLRRTGIDVNYVIVAAVIRESKVPELLSRLNRVNFKIFEIEGDEVLKSLVKLARRGFITKLISATSYSVAENLGNSIAVITMGFKPYKSSSSRRRLKHEILEILREKGALTAYGIWKVNPIYTLRGYYKVLKDMELKREVCSEVILNGNKRVKYYKLCY